MLSLAFFKIMMLSVIKISTTVLNVVIMNIIMLSVLMMNVIMLSLVVLLNLSGALFATSLKIQTRAEVSYTDKHSSLLPNVK